MQTRKKKLERRERKTSPALKVKNRPWRWQQGWSKSLIWHEACGRSSDTPQEYFNNSTEANEKKFSRMLSEAIGDETKSNDAMLSSLRRREIGMMILFLSFLNSSYSAPCSFCTPGAKPDR
jgi:hypothetical protein